MPLIELTICDILVIVINTNFIFFVNETKILIIVIDTNVIFFVIETKILIVIIIVNLEAPPVPVYNM